MEILRRSKGPRLRRKAFLLNLIRMAGSDYQILEGLVPPWKLGPRVRTLVTPLTSQAPRPPQGEVERNPT